MDLTQSPNLKAAGGSEWLESTPEVVVRIENEVPTLTVATIAGVTVVVLLAIAAMFILGILLDCRQQRMMDQRKEIKKLQYQKRARKSTNIEVVSIADNMEETATSRPPAEALSDIP